MAHVALRRKAGGGKLASERAVLSHHEVVPDLIRPAPCWPEPRTGGLIVVRDVGVRDAVGCRLPRSQPEDEAGGCASVVAAIEVAAAPGIAAVVPRRVSLRSTRILNE